MSEQRQRHHSISGFDQAGARINLEKSAHNVRQGTCCQQQPDTEGIVVLNHGFV